MRMVVAYFSRLLAQVGWLALRVGAVFLAASRRSVCIHQMNQLISHDDCGHNYSTINIVVVIIRPHRICVAYMMGPIATDVSVVGRSVGLE